jgi:hypothetical protein
MSVLANKVRRRPADLLLAAEALLLLALFRVGLAVIPVRRIIGVVARGKAEPHEPDGKTLGEREMIAALRVQWAVRAVGRHFPVEFVCFPQTLAAYVMLKWRGLTSTIVYGVGRSPDGDLLAHTWLQMGEGYVVGGEESEGFTPIERWG